MRRTLAALVAAAALGMPTAAEAVTVCPGVGGTRPTFACVSVELNGSGNTVSPSVGFDCTVLGDPTCTGTIVNVGTTGIGSDGHVYVAGMVIL